MTAVGLIVPPDQPPERFREAALAAEGAGLDDVWLWEDCFAESGIAPAAALLEATERVRVGIGLLPVPLRNVALAAMEIATVERLFPGRLLPGIGHGVLDWMGQAGVRAASPMTLLREHATALRALLTGDRVTTQGRYVALDDVALRWPPVAPPPVLIGAVRPKTIALAGEVGDGIIFTGDADADAVRAGLQIALGARATAGNAVSGVDRPFEVVAFLSLPVDASADRIAAEVGGLVDAGATRVPVCPVGPDGAPDGTEAILEFAERLARSTAG